jgi:hypothetical protein
MIIKGVIDIYLAAQERTSAASQTNSEASSFQTYWEV